jgi:multisubunit Na+/H+ antiporter MnhF subunit
VNAFAWAATALLVGYAPLGWIAVRRRPIDGLLAVEMGGILLVLVLVCLAEAFHRSFEYGVAIVAVVMTWIGGLVFARFLGRWV